MTRLLSSLSTRQIVLNLNFEFLTTNSKYKGVILKLINKTNCFIFKFTKNTEIARLYLFTESDEKIDTVYKLE